MSSAARVTRPPTDPPAVAGFARPLRRITVDEYHRMIDAGAFVGGPRCELIHGFILEKPVPNPPHAYACDGLAALLTALVGPYRVVRTQQPVTLGDSEPEPDVAVTAGTRQDFKARHPRPADVDNGAVGGRGRQLVDAGSDGHGLSFTHGNDTQGGIRQTEP